MREGGADPKSNSRLRDVIAKAKAQNVPNDNINRLIQKAAGSDRADYEEIVYEGYGPCGLAFIVTTLTDNRNRTAASMRHYFDKFGAGLGTSGCTSYLFTKKGKLIVAVGEDREELLLEAPAEDYDISDDMSLVITDPADFGEAVSYFENLGVEIVDAEVNYIPSTTVSVEDEDDLKKLNALTAALEDDDDVQDFSTNLLLY